MKNCIKDKSAAHILILLLVIALFVYMLFMAYDHYALRREVNSLKESLSQNVYAQLSSDFPQRATSPKPAEMQLRVRDAIHGVEFNPEVSTTDVKIIYDGVYFLMSRLRAGSQEPVCSNFYFTINNKPLANSMTTICFPEDDSQDKDVIMAQNMVALHAGDEVSVVIETAGKGEGSRSEEDMSEKQPIVPSIVFTMFRLGEI